MEIIGLKTQVETEIQPGSVPVAAVNAERELVRLERRLANYVGTPYCVLTSSGTAGLLTALKAVGVNDGDGVMCTSFSFFATAEIITLAGAEPVLVDINPNTFNIDPYCLEYVLKKCERTRQPLPKALIAADLFGLPCDFDAINEICKRYGIEVIEDMSGAFGASYKGKKTGNFGRFSVASFFPARPLGGIGDGGGIFCRTREDARMLEHLRGDSENQPYDFVQASIVNEKLSGYSAELSRRQLVAARYRDNLKGVVKVQLVEDEYISAYTQFVIALADEKQREAVIDALHDKHVPSSILHCTQRAHPIEKDWERVVLTNTQHAAQRLLAIPMHPHLSVHVIDYVSKCIIQTVKSTENE